MKTSTIRLFGAATLALLALLACATSVQAKQVHQYFYSGNTFDAGPNPVSIAFDATNDAVLVVNTSTNGTVRRFNAAGAPAPFASLAGESVLTPTAGDTLSNVDVAVDNSAGTDAGNFYLSSTFEGPGVYGFAPGGTALSGFPFKLSPPACKVAVANDGHVWLAVGEGFREFTSTGLPTGISLVPGAKTFNGGFSSGCRIDFDSAGNFYVSRGSEQLEKFSPTRADMGIFAPGNPQLVVDRGDDTVFTLSGTLSADLITQYDSSGNPLVTLGGPDPGHSYAGLSGSRDFTVNPDNHDLYVLREGTVDIFSRDPAVVTIPNTKTEPADGITGTTATLHGTISADNVNTTNCHFEWGTTISYGNSSPCLVSGVPTNVFSGSGSNVVTANLTGLKKGQAYHFRLVAENGESTVKGLGRDATFSAADPPLIGEVLPRHITSDSFRATAAINPNGANASFHVDIGTDITYGRSVPVPEAEPESLANSKTILVSHDVSQEIGELSPGTTYHYRFVATNASGTVVGGDHTFTTFAVPTGGIDNCPNALARQQTGAAGLLDCRAYELVSAAFTGGYDVRSDLTTGGVPLPTSPEAHDAAIYSMVSGTVPGIAGNPTNRGADPYVATRGIEGWTTRYVGLPADNPNAGGPFASPLRAFDSALDTFAFGGPDICAPCFADGSTNVPLRRQDGSLEPGMAGSMDPGPADPDGVVKKPLSGDGTHFVFSSELQFEPAGNPDDGNMTIYDRNLETGTTQVASTDPSGTTLADGADVVELDISDDGSRILIGDRVQTDGLGNDYWHLYMHVGNSAETIDLTPGASAGVLYNGMTSDGSKVYFTSTDPLLTAADQDTDTSADLFRADVSGSSSTLVRASVGVSSTGDTNSCNPAGNSFNSSDWNVIPGGPTDCSVVAIGGTGGVARGDGSVYFLSPELLDGNGVLGAPNIFLARPGDEPHFVATLESGASTPVPPEKSEFDHYFGTFSNPVGAAIDTGDGSSYVYDAGTAGEIGGPGANVQKFDSEGNLLTGYGTGGKNDGSGSGEAFQSLGDPSEISAFSVELGGPAITNPIPSQIAVDNFPSSPSYHDLYVLSTKGFNGFAVRKFGSAGNYISSISIGGVFSFIFPGGVTVDNSTGKLYVGELELFTGTPSVRVYNASGSPVAPTSIPVTGMPYGLAVDASGKLYVANGNSTRIYDATTGASLGILDPNPSSGVAVDPVSNHVFVDEGDQIVEYDSTGSPVGDPIGEGVIEDSVNLAAHEGRLVVSNPSGKNAALFTPLTPSNRAYDSPIVIHGVKEANVRYPTDFQTNASGEAAAFPTTLSLTGFNSVGKYEVMHYDAVADDVACASCTPTDAAPSTDASLADDGLSVTDDGRLLFGTGEPLVLRDSNEARDVYEWSDGTQELISTGTSADNSTLLSASSDGSNVFFFTRQRLVQEDNNGSNVRLYTAREEGGIAHGPPSFSCAASDECHGRGSEAVRPASPGTIAGTPSQLVGSKKCRKGKVRRHGRCVKRHRPQHQKRANAKQGGGK